MRDITLEMLRDLLGLVMKPEEVPSDDVLDALTQAERETIAQWVGDCHFEASDNPGRADPMPVVLRDRLPENHPYKTWRVS